MRRVCAAWQVKTQVAQFLRKACPQMVVIGAEGIGTPTVPENPES
jgi:hypothetical protein